MPRGIHTEIECLRLDFHVCMTWQSSHIIVRWNPWKSSLRHSISNRGFFKCMPLSAVSLALSLSLASHTHTHTHTHTLSVSSQSTHLRRNLSHPPHSSQTKPLTPSALISNETSQTLHTHLRRNRPTLTLGGSLIFSSLSFLKPTTV